MEDIRKFTKYFNSSFWKFFQGKQALFNVPSAGLQRENFIENLYHEIIQRKYYPSVPKISLNINKGHGVTRIIPVFEIKDYCIYYYCIKKLEGKIAFNRVENTFGGWTLGGLMRRGENEEMATRKARFDKREEEIAELAGISAPDYSFNPAAWARAYGDLNAKLYATAREAELHFAAEFDVANFYDSIRLDILENRIRELSDSSLAEVISLLFHFLNYWNRETNLYNKQSVGLPQDAMGDCSRILANFYLQTYDSLMAGFCKLNDCRYLRYADDQFVFAKDLSALERVLFEASKQLNSIGLSINQKKVGVMTTDELIEYRSFEVFDILKKDKDRKDKRKVEKFVDKYLELQDHGGLARLNKGGLQLLNRVLFCPATRQLPRAKKARLLACYLDTAYLLNAKAIHLERINKLLPYKIRPGFIRKLNRLARESIHNSFHYEVLQFYQTFGMRKSPILKRLMELKTML
jgi:hypothetical protein